MNTLFFGIENHPCLIGIVGRWRDENSSRFDVEIHQYKNVSQARMRNEFIRKEVAMLKRRSVSLEELVPSTGPTLWTRFKSISFQDVLHCVLADGLDAQFLKFT